MPSILGRHRSDGAPPERLPLLLPLLLLLLLLLAGGEGAAPRTDGQLAIQAWEPVRDGCALHVPCSIRLVPLLTSPCLCREAIKNTST